MMDIKILKDERIVLPIEYDGEDCDKAICDRLNQFADLLREHSAGAELIKLVNGFCSNLERMYKEYYLGHQNKAYQAFKDAIIDQTKGMKIITTELPKESLYRARVNAGNRDYKNDEMFHIKYDLRGKVQTQRFSFPGLPCLYLGGSAYVCWVELNRPQLDQFQVATIRQKDQEKNFKVIDLCIHPLTYYQELIQNKESRNEKQQILDIKEYLQWWPIMAACSIAVKNESDSFKPEYIFPQFMLQYLLEEVKDDSWVGIKYMSIKAGKISRKQYESNYRTYTNYVIPIKSLKENADGFCSFLKDRFGVARNYSGKELQVLTDSIRRTGIRWGEIGEEKKTDEMEEMKLYATNDMAYSYSKSIFGRIEIILENKDLDKYSKEEDIFMSEIPE